MSYYIMFSYNYISASQEPGDVLVDVLTDAGSRLGRTFFRYNSSNRDLVQQLIKDPNLQAQYFFELSKHFKFLGNDSNIAKESQGNVKKQTLLG